MNNAKCRRRRRRRAHVHPHILMCHPVCGSGDGGRSSSGVWVEGGGTADPWPSVNPGNKRETSKLTNDFWRFNAQKCETKMREWLYIAISASLLVCVCVWTYLSVSVCECVRGKASRGRVLSGFGTPTTICNGAVTMTLCVCVCVFVLNMCVCLH